MTVKEISEAADLSGGARALVKDDSTPSAYLESLEKQQLYDDAIKFLAYKMEPPAGVKWACACTRELQSPEAKQEKNEALDASEQWAKAPSDEGRWAAKQASDKSKARGGSKLIAMAVFLSGGSIAPPPSPEVPPPKNTAQKMIAGSVQSAVMGYQPEKATERYKRALAIGKTMG